MLDALEPRWAEKVNRVYKVYIKQIGFTTLEMFSLLPFLLFVLGIPRFWRYSRFLWYLASAVHSLLSPCFHLRSSGHGLSLSSVKSDQPRSKVKQKKYESIQGCVTRFLSWAQTTCTLLSKLHNNLACSAGKCISSVTGVSCLVCFHGFPRCGNIDFSAKVWYLVPAETVALSKHQREANETAPVALPLFLDDKQKANVPQGQLGGDGFRHSAKVLLRMAWTPHEQPAPVVTRPQRLSLCIFASVLYFSLYDLSSSTLFSYTAGFHSKLPSALFSEA